MSKVEKKKKKTFKGLFTPRPNDKFTAKNTVIFCCVAFCFQLLDNLGTGSAYLHTNAVGNCSL